ncbi:MAG: SMP-30/gluconolactonase/LRE family protein [Flavisolibacter sp.]
MGLNCHPAYSQVRSIVFEDPKPRLISSQFTFTEGPAVDKHGNIFFTDQPNNKIWEYNTNGKLSIFMNKAGRSNGMHFDKKGNLITCADEQNEVWSINPKGKIQLLLTNYKGHRLNGPNDLWIDAKGGIYFTDPYFQRDYWQRQNPDSNLGGENIYYLAPGNKEALLFDGPLMKPNGLVGTADGKSLFVSEMGKGRILKYSILNNGMLSDKKIFVKDLADGMKLDKNGNLYLAGKGITVYDSSANQIEHIDIPSDWTSNLCFGGRYRNLLFITATSSIYILHMKIRGVE